jgi:hypothetical protein
LIRVTRERIRHTSPVTFRQNWLKIVDLALLSHPGVPVVAVLPTLHRAKSFASSTRYHDEVRQAVLRLAADRAVATLDLPLLQRDSLASDLVDGSHWTWALHCRAGLALGDLVARALSASREDHRQGATENDRLR